MPRVGLNRTNPTPRLTAIAAAASRRSVAAIPEMVEAEVNEIAEELGTSIGAINETLNTVDERLYNLENPIP